MPRVFYACTCNPDTIEAEFRNGVGSVPIRITVVQQVGKLCYQL